MDNLYQDMFMKLDLEHSKKHSWACTLFNYKETGKQNFEKEIKNQIYDIPTSMSVQELLHFIS